MRLARRQAGRSVDEENPYWVSFSDILSALLVIFILASVILILQLMERQRTFDEEVAVLQVAEQVRRDILREARDKLEARGIVVELSENDSVLRIPNDSVGFDTGAFELRSQDTRNALEIGQVLSEVITQGDRLRYLDTVFVEGHTDSRPFPGFMGKGNWGLSTFRAISLWQYWSDQLEPDQRLDTLKNIDENPLFSVSGYADTRPAVEGDEEEDHDRNRRIDVRFTIRRPESTDYRVIRDLLRQGE